MIYTRLKGSLGEQMFQYAAARARALDLGTGVILDDRQSNIAGRGCLNMVFDLPVETSGSLPPAEDSGLPYLYWRLSGQSPKRRRERGTGYDPAFMTWPDDSYLDGAWQSERYFAAHADTIRSDFTFRPMADSQNAQAALRIAGSPSVSLHATRSPGCWLIPGPASGPRFWDAALKAIAETMDTEPVVFVFSDDPDWAHETVSLGVETVFIDHNGPAQSYEDMRLMSMCMHNILSTTANAWWAGWLNANENKFVAVPARWIGDPRLPEKAALPARWNAIEPVG
ncbi:alpha-1,2-fucosyltransferase [Chachezhania sediminis]|uniref:alpha-1,2-fucosyltransferase n=1 Tax=Chachezhania sediminis TaxID=2599291 RepID=UPI00131D9744|nr:alpha-1,2-fucosyltransferase [Chachezhania sediminis]